MFWQNAYGIYSVAQFCPQKAHLPSQVISGPNWHPLLPCWKGHMSLMVPRCSSVVSVPQAEQDWPWKVAFEVDWPLLFSVTIIQPPAGDTEVQRGEVTGNTGTESSTALPAERCMGFMLTKMQPTHGILMVLEIEVHLYLSHLSQSKQGSMPFIDPLWPDYGLFCSPL